MKAPPSDRGKHTALATWEAAAVTEQVPLTTQVGSTNEAPVQETSAENAVDDPDVNGRVNTQH
jgi:hypothetical protein